MNLTDDQWSLLQPFFLPAHSASPHRTNRGRPACSDRLVLDAIFWVRRTGSSWRDLPPGYPSYLTWHRRELEWTCSGLMRRILATLIDELNGRFFPNRFQNIKNLIFIHLNAKKARFRISIFQKSPAL